MAALLTAIAALFVSVGAAVYTRSSSQSAANAVALTLSTDVEIRLMKRTDLTHNRWMYNGQSPISAQRGWAPPGAEPGIAFTTPGEDEVTIGLAIPISVKNSGKRRAKVSLPGDFVIAKGLTVETPWERVSDDRVILDKVIDLDAGKSQNLVLYQGMKVKDWFANGKSTDPVTFKLPLSASAGVDSVTQHWEISITAAIFEPISGNSSGARVVATPTPVPQLREVHRTYPRRAFSLRYKLMSSKVD